MFDNNYDMEHFAFAFTDKVLVDTGDQFFCGPDIAKTVGDSPQSLLYVLVRQSLSLTALRYTINLAREDARKQFLSQKSMESGIANQETSQSPGEPDTLPVASTSKPIGTIRAYTKQMRMRYRPEVKYFLDTVYQRIPYASSHVAVNRWIAARVDLHPCQVRVYFMNRRRKDRLQQKTHSPADKSMPVGQQIQLIKEMYCAVFGPDSA